MKIKKSALGIILLVIAMIGNMVPSMAFASSKDFSESVARVEQLGVISGSGITDLNSYMTREQLVAALVAAADMTEKAEN